MLGCGLQVEEISNVILRAMDLKDTTIYVLNGKGGKERVVYMSDAAYLAFASYLRVRLTSEEKKLLLFEKGP